MNLLRQLDKSLTLNLNEPASVNIYVYLFPDILGAYF